MIRVALPLIGGRTWTGGYNYLLNLVSTVQRYAPGRLTPVVLFGPDSTAAERAPFEAVTGVEVVVDAAFAGAGRGPGLVEAVVAGRDSAAVRAFREHHIDVVFEAARYYGWRLPLPAVAWIPDFQHRHLTHLFSPAARLRRAIGFNLQILSGRPVMLSSQDAQADCERFHPLSRSRTRVISFAVARDGPVDPSLARAAADRYELPREFIFLPNQFSLHKNHELVIEALGLLRAEGRRLTVAASGEHTDPRDSGRFARLIARAGELGVAEMFRPLGMIPYADIALLMRASMALLNPSLFEGWSTTVEEAKGTGTPMLLSDLRVHREQAGERAVYFDPREPADLARVLAGLQAVEEGERQRLARTASRESQVQARRFAESFVEFIEQATVKRSTTRSCRP